VALLDLTLMGSAKEAVVFTPSHCFVHHDGGRLWFAWSEVRFVRPPAGGDDALVLRLATRGELALPCGRHAETMHQIAAELVAIPG
jgi:hypothetical protein